MLANGVLPVVSVPGLTARPLPNPLPEGRGDWVGALDKVEVSRRFRLNPYPTIGTDGSLSLQGEGWGEGYGLQRSSEAEPGDALFASKLAPMERRANNRSRLSAA
ncbi:hypothetical protein Pssp01_20690 [Pseudomonas sp. NBRC 100443]|nr:hypothetical protein Pssp01_20690 [Pseudomonas sp. NBRC 100443]